MLSIAYHDETLHLLPARAVWWPARRTLLVADTHFGKDATFRAAGIPLPVAALSADLVKLTQLVADTGAERLIVLGDLLHARGGRTEATWNELRAWRRDHASLAWLNLRGNHDRHAGDPLEELAITCQPRLDEPPFTLLHATEATSADKNPDSPSDQTSSTRATIAGHIHPAVELHGPRGQRIRLPCFHFAPDEATLPAFGSLTGTHVIKPRSGDRVYVVVDGRVLEPSKQSR
jgi:DNA ligase-associated metallophosphoesterase